MSSRNNGMDRYEPYATADEMEKVSNTDLFYTLDEPEDLAQAMTIKEAADATREFLRSLPDDLVDSDDLGTGF